ncbi:MAG: toprim domain-containing protein [Acidimicrobiales bacterium]
MLNDDGRAAYLQARYLRPRFHKYDNPSSSLAGPSPRVAEMRLPDSARDDGVVLVTEGIPDGLTAAQAGYRAVAVLGAGLPDERVVSELTRRFPTERLVIAFDADDRGRAGASTLAELLGARGLGDRVGVLQVPEAWGDLNGWQMCAGREFNGELAAEVERARGGRIEVARGEAPRNGLNGLRDDLEAIRYRFLLQPDPLESARNLGQLREVMAGWETEAPTRAGSAVCQDVVDVVESLCYRYLSSDDGRLAVARHELVSETLERWSQELGLDRDLRPTPDLAREPPTVADVPELELEIGR